ncbi:endonuclease/exonuclease/phosphatase family metal-dependent hydrolase [Streptacidiphilus sp. MAP12-20]|uniref:endonuclease/exonuclease/phosphatase family protein n=1 Tax=Streptacidiphilus sp. MAP12-20 TaxID=3156299 RepID=UPI0035119D7F
MAANSRSVSVGTWNIGGGILGDSHQRSGTAQLDYHVQQLLERSPDVLCLQESHEFRDGRTGQAAEIAKALGADAQQTARISGSHLDPDADLSLAILSRSGLSAARTVMFHNPGLSWPGPTGERWDMFDKGYLVAEVEFHGVPVRIVNAHLFPFHYFGARATEPRFSSLWRDFADDLLTLAGAGPTIATIDLNHEPIESVLGSIFEGRVFGNAFSHTPSTPKGVQQDYIVYTAAQLSLLETSVVPTQADHHYCQAVFALPEPPG